MLLETGIGLGIKGISALGSLFGVKSQNDANNTNYKIAQMNNEFNERMMQKQMDYNTQMWNAENEYNTAANQVARYKAAGLNPALMMQNGGSAGMASSANSVEQPTASPYQYNPVDYSSVTNNLSSLGDSVMSGIYDSEFKQEQVAGLRIENRYKAQQILKSIDNMIADTRDKNATALGRELMNNFYDETWRSEQLVRSNQARMLASQAKLNVAKAVQTDVLTDLSRKDLQYYDQQKVADLSLIMSSILLNKAKTYQSYQDAKKSISEAVLNYAYANKVDVDRSLVEATFESTVRNLYWQSVGQMNEATTIYDEKRKYLRNQNNALELSNEYQRKENDYQEIDMMFRALKDGSSAFFNVSAGAGSFLSGKSQIGALGLKVGEKKAFDNRQRIGFH